MASTSMRHEGHEGMEPSDADVDPHLMANRDDNDEEPFMTVGSSSPPRIEGDSDRYLLLFQAARNGDWETAKRFLYCDPHALTAHMPVHSMTVLQIAASGGSFQFVERIVELMPTEYLEIKDYRGRTALHFAAMSGSIKTATVLVRRNPRLTQLTDINGHTPLLYAALWASKEMLQYLFAKTRDETINDYPSPFTGPFAAQLISSVTAAGFYDVALCLVQRYPYLATAGNDGKNGILRVLAKKPSAFHSGSRLGFWGSCIYQFIPVALNHAQLDDINDSIENPTDPTEVLTSMQIRSCLTRVLQWFNGLLWKAIELLAPCTKQVHDEKLRHKQAAMLLECVWKEILKMKYSEAIEFFTKSAILTTATRLGIVEIVKECLRNYPDLIWLRRGPRSILQIAVEYRREKIFNLMQEKIARDVVMNSWIFESANGILHLAAKLPPPPLLKSVAGSALQMQRELQWFKEVEKFVHPSYKEAQNADMKTAWEVFTEEHKVLVESGEKWMKDTSNSCMLVSTLIATVAFAAVFTVPGGNNNDNGIPIFLKHSTFLVFAISDAVALFSSSTSLLSFLSILTSRYADEDFLKSLPKRLLIGLTSLFIAVVTMMIAFGAALSIVLSERLGWVFLPVILVASFPVILFAMLHLPLFIQMVQLTYGSGIFH